MGIFRDNIFKQFWSKVETTIKVVPTFYDKLVYLEITESVFRCESLQSGHSKEEPKFTHYNNEKVYSSVVRLDYYQSQVKKFKDDPRWALNIEYQEDYQTLSEEYLNAYKEGRNHEFDHENNYQNRSNKESILELLKKGRFDLIGIDHTSLDGTILGIDGKPIVKGFFFGYIESGLNIKKYRLKALLIHLESLPNVRAAKIVEIPYYNVDSDSGNRSIEFCFMPTQEQFDSLIEMDSWNRSQEVLKILGVEQFAKPKDEDE